MTWQQTQRGVGVLALLLLVGGIALFLGVSWHLWLTPYFAEERRVLDALERAEQALDGYCKLNSGKLPLPVDKLDNPVAWNGAGRYVGYLPYKMLGLPRWSVMQPSGNTEGELWYAVQCDYGNSGSNNCNVGSVNLSYRMSTNGKVLNNNQASISNAKALVLHPGPLLAGQDRGQGPAVMIGNFLEGADSADNPLRLSTLPPGKVGVDWSPVVTSPAVWRVADQDTKWNDVGRSVASVACDSNSALAFTLSGSGPNGQPVAQAFQPAGNGARVESSDPDPEIGNQPVLRLESAAGAAGGCLWFDPAAVGYPAPLSLAGKSWRAYWAFRLDHADPVGGSDRGYGYTWSLVAGGSGLPNTCGLQQQMGVITTGSWQNNHFLEFDVYDQPSHHDPRHGTPLQGANHVAIKHGGALAHIPGNGDGLARCHAGVGGNCPISSRDRWEEAPPQSDRVRVEIDARCNSDCSQCTMAQGDPLLTHARWRVWLACDAPDCTDLTVPKSAAPAASACVPLNPALAQVYFGFTGGWTSGVNMQGVKIWDFRLRIE